jgi:hypothetical protein
MHALNGVVAAAAAFAVGALAAGSVAAAPVVGFDAVRSAADSHAPIEKTQFFFGGQNYCWYPIGWHGPGFYWCGYAERTGLGWGGPEGWRGWHGRGGGMRRGFHDGFGHRDGGGTGMHGGFGHGHGGAPRGHGHGHGGGPRGHGRH